MFDSVYDSVFRPRFPILVMLVITLLFLTTPASAQPGTIRIEWVGGDTDILITPPNLPTTVTGRLLVENPVPAGDLTRMHLTLYSYDGEIMNVASSFGPVTFIGEVGRYEINPAVPIPLPADQITEIATFTVAVPTPDQITIGLGDADYDLTGSSNNTLEAALNHLWGAWINPASPQLTISTLVFPARGTNRGGTSQDAVISNDIDAGPFFFDPNGLGDACGPFQILNTSQLGIIENGFFAKVNVLFDVATPGSYSCNLPLGGGYSLPVEGVWRVPIHAMTATPDSADFGEVPVGGFGSIQLTLSNDGDYDEASIPTITGDSDLLDFYKTYNISPSSTLFQTVTYGAPDFDPRTWQLDFDGLAQVDLAGRGRVGTSAISVAADTVRIFPGEGDTGTAILGIRNTGEVTFLPTFAIDDPNGLFAAFDMDPAPQLPGTYVSYVFSYSAPDRVIRTAAVDIGSGLGQTVLLGQGMLPYPAGSVTPALLELPTAAVGEKVTGQFTVRNLGNTTLSPVNISTATEVYVNGPTNLAPGLAATYTVNGTPVTWGQITGRIVVNQNPDMEVEFVVPPVFDFGPDENRLRVFFDPVYSVSDTTVPLAPQVLPAYLVLNNPSDAEGIAAWSCRLDLPDGAALTGATPSGTTFNAASAANEFAITLLDFPLPSTSAVLLAELQLLVWDPALTEVIVSVRPLADPALPGLATWVPGTAGALPLPMVVEPGVYAAGTIRLQSPTSAAPDLPTPGWSRLLANVPNPFNPQTEIRFEMANAGQALVRVYDVQGRLVRELANSHYPAGNQAVVWDGRDQNGRAVASGAYYVRLVTNRRVDRGKILLLK